jgi:colanic acid/amylovoran biosynthesis glycosyltransferase
MRTDATRHLGYVLKRFPRISETFVANELIELARQGERVTVFAVSRPDEPFTHGFVSEVLFPVVYLPRRPLREPIRVARAVARGVRRDPRRFFRTAVGALWPPRLRGFRRLLQAAVLHDEMRRAGIDHAHAHFASAAARLANLAFRMGGPSYSVTAHAKDIYHREIRLDHLRDKLGDATFVATVSTSNRDYLESILDGRARVCIVPNAVDLRRFQHSRTQPREASLVLAVARLVEKKGLANLIEASGRLTDRGVAVRLEIVGDGPLRSELEQLGAQANAQVVFYGALPQEELFEYYRRATVFCMPCVVASTGDRDGLPTSVLEAMALGVPVVATSVNGLSEVVIHEQTGLVVPEHDTVALADAIERLLTDRAFAERLALSAHHHVERSFSLEQSASLLRSLFPIAA